MKTHLLRWVSIALFFLVATLSVALHLTRAAHEPCRPFPEVCIPEIQPRRVNRSLVPTRTGESPQFYIDTALRGNRTIKLNAISSFGIS